MKKLAFLAAITSIFYAFTTVSSSNLNYTIFKVQDKTGCHTTLNYETFMMSDKLSYELKNKIINKKKEALKTEKTNVNTQSFSISPTDWIVIYEANYGKRTCKSGDYIIY